MIAAIDLVRRIILADATIAAELGGRIYPLKLPQNSAYPAATLQLIATVRRPHLRGPGGLSAPLYQLDVWTQEKDAATGFKRARELAERIRQAIDGYTGILEDAPSGDRVRVSVLFQDARDDFEPDVNGGYYRISTDYTIWNQHL